MAITGGAENFSTGPDIECRLQTLASKRSRFDHAQSF
jgi:hypothetical protein